MLSPKRAGYILAGLILLVLFLEIGLSVVRTRRVTAELVASGPTAIPSLTPTVSATAGENIPSAEVNAALVVSTKGTPLVNVVIDFRIGPRFPATNLYAEAFNSSGNIVAANAETFECGADALRCEGTATLALSFGNIEQQIVARRATALPVPTFGPQDWPTGTYSVRVSRNFGNLDSTVVFEQTFIVAE